MLRLPIAAIDPSLTSTGICYGTDADDWQTVTCKSKPRGGALVDRIIRYEGIIEQVQRVLATVRPRVILIEEYAYSSNQSGQMYLGEFGGLLRWHLIDYTPHVLEVAPTCLKKFATGKGNSPKDMVMAHVSQRWGKLFASNDEADAFVMYQMALCIAGRQEPATTPQREAVAKVVAGHTATQEQIAEFCIDATEPF